MIRRIAIIYILLHGICAYHTSAQNQPHGEVRDSVKIYFRQGYSVLDTTMRDNRIALDRIADSLRMGYSDSIYRLRKILVVGGASPEGSIPLNKRLSEKRADVLFNYLSRYGSLPDSLKVTEFLGRDWNGLIQLVENDRNVPYREATLKLLREIAAEADNGRSFKDNHLRRIQQLHNGVPYRYMYRNLFPELRASRLHLWFEKTWNPKAPIPAPKVELTLPPSRIDTIFIHDTIYVEVPAPCPSKPFYMDIRTNMLYDLLAVPNVGAEFYLGRNWSVAANWMYAWWKTDRRHRYWRAYGGDIALRKWFGRAAEEKSLTGHHLGVYGQMLTYDFEFGGKGQMAGVPGGDIWDKANWAVGLEYGYSLPVARRLNIDFTVGLGYMGGTYYEYTPIDNCYVWQATKQRHWWGPTKLEVSLVWLLGHGNFNAGKGGKR